MTSHAGFFASKLTVGSYARTTAREVYSMGYYGGYSSRYYYIISAESSRVSGFSADRSGSVK